VGEKKDKIKKMNRKKKQKQMKKKVCGVGTFPTPFRVLVNNISKIEVV
jgi:hypothetical protein